MSAPKFTPGETWRVITHIDRRYIVASSERTVIMVYRPDDCTYVRLGRQAVEDGLQLDDLRKCAASPDLYAALEEAVAQLKVAMKRAEDEGSPHARVYEEVREIGLAALARARGEA